MSLRLFVLGGLVLSTFMVPNARAQEESGASAALEEVLVVARRREERLQDVPLAVQVLDGEQIELAGIKEFSEIASRTPGMTFAAAGSTDLEIFIRGIGTDLQGAAVDNPVGFFLDGVYLSRNTGAQMTLYDLERVEVLKGPQSLRFGKNIVGGLVHYVSKKPTRDPEAKLEVTVGDFDQLDISGAIRGPLGENWAYSLTGLSNDHDGYGDNTIGEDAESLDRSAFRGQLLFESNDDWSVLIAADTTRIRSTGRWVDIVEAGDSDAVTFNSFFADPITELPGFVLPARNAPFDNSDPRRGPRNTVGGQQTDIDGAAVTVERSAANGLSFQSITAYRKNDLSMTDDGCGIHWDYPVTMLETGLLLPDPSAGILAATDALGYLATVPDCWFNQYILDTADQFSQEVRVSGDIGESSNWSIGAFYLNEDIERTENIAFLFPDFNVITEFAGCTFGGTIDFCGPPTGFIQSAGLSRATTLADATNIGLFGEVQFALSDSWVLDIGVRWVDDEKDFVVTRSGESFDEPVCMPDDMGILPPGCEVEGFFTVSETNSWDDVLPSISLSYAPSDNSNWYFRYAEGYKPGGYTGLGAGQPTTALVSFDPEFSESFEVGAKLLLADRRLRLNVAAHHTDYEDLQTQQFVALDPTRPPDFFVVNARNGTRAYGLETDFAIAASEYVTVYGNYAFTKCEFQGELIIDEFGTDIDGNTCRRTPEHGMAVGFDASVPSNTVLWNFGADYQWKDEYFFNNENDALQLVDSEYTLNLRFGISSTDEIWDLNAWVKNATDELNTASVFEIFGTVTRNYLAPRTYGVTYRHRF